MMHLFLLVECFEMSTSGTFFSHLSPLNETLGGWTRDGVPWAKLCLDESLFGSCAFVAEETEMHRDGSE